MAQADYIISNQTFPNTRADINNHLSAIATNNSGTSAPTTQYAGQFWIDTTTTTWTLYIHDGTDDIQFATIDTSANTVNFIDSALDVVTDTTPQLGGNLDLNSNDITGTGNINITGNITASGNLAGTLTTASQPNITSVGTLTSFTSTGIDDNATSTAITIDSSENVGIGTTSPANYSNYTTLNLGQGGIGSILQLDGLTSGHYHIVQNNNGAMIISADHGNVSGSTTINFLTDGSERMRIDSSGNVLVGTTLTDVHNQTSDAGTVIESGGRIEVAQNSSPPVLINRFQDGALVNFYGQGVFEGSISVSGTTVSYNGFTGTHWSRLSDNSKPTILKGTILESLDEMMDWYQVEFDFIKTDDEGNETTIRRKESYTLGENESVGDVITYTYKGTDYQATIIQEGEIKHTKSKISDTVDAKNVYGVFMAWDNDDDTVNDMYVAQTGTFVVRMNSAETVSKGDLIQSNGDGTGKVQADDLLRASTVAKVLSTTKIETYEDGSYIVPCSLHC